MRQPCRHRPMPGPGFRLWVGCWTGVVGLVFGATLGAGTGGAAFVGRSANANRFAAAPSFLDYPQAVLASGPDDYYRLDDLSTVMADSGHLGHAGTFIPAVGSTDRFDRPGAPVGAGSRAVSLDGTSSYLVGDSQIDGPQTFSVEAWFQTTSTSGGKLIGFGNNRTGLSTAYDRHVYLRNDGRITFGVLDGSLPRTVTGTASYNDGAWHHVVASYGGGTLELYVDGQRRATGTASTAMTGTGYWRVGGDQLAGWPAAPTSNFLDGSVDEVAVYPVALGAAQVSAHYQAAQSGTYRAAVLADDPNSYWRLDETGPPVALDTSGHGATATYRLGPPVRVGASGALLGGQSGSTAVVLDGIRGGAYRQAAQTAPATFTLEAWFRTSTPRGGKLIGFGNLRTGLSTRYDRHLYLTDSGQVVFGVQTDGGPTTVTSPGTYRNGAWHLVTASIGPAGMRLYLDGSRVATNSEVTAASLSGNGYWRLGGDNLAGWPSRPSSDYYAGSLDEVAIYLDQLSDATVRLHYDANRA